MKTPSHTIKHVPFDSIYRQEYEVVEERRGNLSLFPHTDQLPVIFRALNLEFHGALPNKISHVDARADGYHKLLREFAVDGFMLAFNIHRADNLRLACVYTPDLIASLAIVQQITETTPLGLRHSFRFYSGSDFVPDVHLSGKRLVFADHVLQRFSSRVPNSPGEELSRLLNTFFRAYIVSMPVGTGRALILSFQDSLLAFTYRETGTEYFITTCLTIHEISSMGLEFPAEALNLHYGSAFARPRLRTWIPSLNAVEFSKCWERKTPPTPLKPLPPRWDWHRFGRQIKDIAAVGDHIVPGAGIGFVDHIHGPVTFIIPPGGKPPAFDEIEVLKQTDRTKKFDWGTADNPTIISVMGNEAAMGRINTGNPPRPSR